MNIFDIIFTWLLSSNWLLRIVTTNNLLITPTNLCRVSYQCASLWNGLPIGVEGDFTPTLTCLNIVVDLFPAFCWQTGPGALTICRAIASWVSTSFLRPFSINICWNDTNKLADYYYPLLTNYYQEAATSKLLLMTCY